MIECTVSDDVTGTTATAAVTVPIAPGEALLGWDGDDEFLSGLGYLVRARVGRWSRCL